MDFIKTLDPIYQALLATLFTWGMTAMGAAVVFLRRNLGQRLLDSMLGFAAGVMIAASYWSLLAPAIELSEAGPMPVWLPAASGFLIGGVFLSGIDRILPHLHVYAPKDEPEGVRSTWQRTTLLVLAITLHNIPEGLAVGVAFGAAAQTVGDMGMLPAATLAGAAALAVGIGIQNFPEAIAVSLPLRNSGASRFKSFWYGQLSGLVEPIAAVLGVLAVQASTALLPYALAFAAGAMIFVVVEDLIPEAQRHGHNDLATTGAMVGFAVMMVLDVAFG